MKKYTDLMHYAKSHIDHGFSQAGKRLSPDDPAQRALMLLASRAVAVGNALMLLSLNNHANEGLPLLRSLLQLAVEMRWIAAAESAERAKVFFETHKLAEWERLWGTKALRERMRELGFQKALEERALSWAFDHLHANAQGLPWGHVFGENMEKGISGDEALRAAAAIMGHVLKALELHWPGKFDGAEHLWETSEMTLS
jgi:hypothetical protein